MANTVNFIEKRKSMKGNHTDQILREADEFESWCNQQILKMENSKNFDIETFKNEVFRRMNFKEGAEAGKRYRKLNNM